MNIRVNIRIVFLQALMTMLFIVACESKDEAKESSIDKITDQKELAYHALFDNDEEVRRLAARTY